MIIPIMYHFGRPTNFNQYHQFKIGTQAKIGERPAILNILDNPNLVRMKAAIHKPKNNAML